MITEARLSKKDGYIRPKKTMQDKLTATEIKEKLEDYVEVDDIDSVPLNTHIRYFTKVKKDGKTKKLFRMGGFLKNKTNSTKYVILTNGRASWSVQIKDSIFFRKLNMDEMKEQYEDEIEDLQDEVKKLKKENKKLKETIKKLKSGK